MGKLWVCFHYYTERIQTITAEVPTSWIMARIGRILTPEGLMEIIAVDREAIKKDAEITPSIREQLASIKRSKCKGNRLQE